MVLCGSLVTISTLSQSWISVFLLFLAVLGGCVTQLWSMKLKDHFGVGDSEKALAFPLGHSVTLCPSVYFECCQDGWRHSKHVATVR